MRITSELGPGKTAPRLIKDLLCYDPLHPRNPPSTDSPNYNVLRDPPPEHQDGLPPKHRLPADACHHCFTIKPTQSQLRQTTADPTPQSLDRIAVVCQECRLHVDILIDYKRPLDGSFSPCPCMNGIFFPVHHLCIVSSAPYDDTYGHTPADQYVFHCSSSTCAVRVIVTVKQPRISPRHVKLLTDPFCVRNRDRQARQKDPTRFAETPLTTPSSVVRTLAAYLENAYANGPAAKRTVNADNKRFAPTLGGDAAPILQFLHWTEIHEVDADGRPQDMWKIPEVGPHKNPVELNRYKAFLEDYWEELRVLLFAQRKKDSNFKATDTSIEKEPIVALKELKRSLNCEDFGIEAKKQAIDLTRPEHPHYASLGATQDFKDEHVEFAYNRQKTTDPKNAAYYYDCLIGIADGRNSDSLSISVATYASEGAIGRKDIANAYESFSLNPNSTSLTDNDIINAFRNHMDDSSKEQEPTLRQRLHVIGCARNSKEILSFANKTIETYDDALAYLDASKDTPDDFVVAVAASKISEHKEDTEKVHAAVRIIASERRSEPLENWLRTGQTEPLEMDAKHAYSRLGLEDQTMDDATVVGIFQMRVEDSPEQASELRAALLAIGKERASAHIENYLRSGKDSNSQESQRSSGRGDWPVGLNNIGNTCYLNSLLQYLFSIRPLRDRLLMAYDDMMIDAHSLEVQSDGKSTKRILSTRITRKQVLLSQDFAKELRNLFQDLIETPYASITPAHGLAIRTLMPLDDGKTRRMTLTSTEDRPIQGPQLPPGQSGASMAKMQKTVGPSIGDDGSSEGTLIDKSVEDFMVIDNDERKEQQQILDNKENHAPTKADQQPLPSSQLHIEPLENTSPSRLNRELPNTIETLTPPSSPDHTPMELDAPERPPPVPPRPVVAAGFQRDLSEDELSRQQDVAEVFGNVLLQLECAIKPDELDKSGEQLDFVKDLFYGKTKNVITDKSQKKRENVEWFSDIKINAAAGPSDIYSALDGAFDEQQVLVDETALPQYTSICELPKVLQIFVQRSHWDQERKVQYKDESHIAMGEVIYLDRYLDSSVTNVPTQLMKQRREAWRCKKALAGLQRRKQKLEKTEVGLTDFILQYYNAQDGRRFLRANRARLKQLNITLPDALDGTRRFLKKYESLDMDVEHDMVIVQSGVEHALAQAAELSRHELQGMEPLLNSTMLCTKNSPKAINKTIDRTTTRLNSLFDAFTKFPYRLHAVFMHRGSSSFGHYWLHMHDFRSGIWRKYNDATVTEVSRVEVFDPPDPSQSGPKATPYFLVYVRDDMREELAQPVCREIKMTIPPPPAGPPPVHRQTFDVLGNSAPYRGETGFDSSMKENEGEHLMYIKPNWDEGQDEDKGTEFHRGG
ncbi:MAG: ubiquitin-specific protease ubp2 [Vezdaea aestivalis]|nr:MAG: ubiquitin-specific protease ubp2 [Vezdaea aestivalis]